MPKMLAAAILVLAMNLRVPLLSVTPLLQFIRQDYGLSNGVMGLLTTLPLLVFALASSFVTPLSKKVGVGRVMIGSVLVLALGEIYRYLGGIPGLFIGTTIIAFGVVAGNVLIPALVRGFFPNHIGIMTSSYSTLMQVSTTIALAGIVPLSLVVGWELAMLSLVGLAAVALILWLPHHSLTFESAEQGKMPPVITDKKIETSVAGEGTSRDEKVASRKTVSVKKLFSQALAWDVSLFMGIQSFAFYCVSTWLPTIALSHGMSPITAGYVSFVFQASSLLVTFLVPLVLRNSIEQKWTAVGSCICYAVGLVGAFLLSSVPFMMVATALMGIGAGATFAVALMFFVLRTRSAVASATLSGVGQAIGYILASIGPVLLGWLYDWEHGWYSSLGLMLFALLCFGIAGYRSGRNLQLQED